MPDTNPITVNRVKLNTLADIYSTEFTATEKLRDSKEQEWLQDLRQSKCIHDPEIIFEANESKIYSGYTRSKEVPLRAKLNQHLLPEKEKNWEISATPKPRVVDNELQGVVQSLITRDAEGRLVFPTDKEIDTAVLALTQERARNMSVTINDQLTESRHRLKQKGQIKTTIRYGTGVIKGPLTETYSEVETIFRHETGAVSRVLKYIKTRLMGQQPAGQWTQQEVKKYRPVGQSVELWRWYPDMSTTELNKCGFAYELYRMTKHEMRELAAREDFFGDVILDIMTRHPSGNYRVRTWEQQLQTIDPNAPGITVKVEAGRTVTTSGAGTATISNDYEVVERNGYIDGTDLFQAGFIPEDRKDVEFFCSFWFCDKQCIKFSMWPVKVIASITDLYHVFYYEKDETSIFGTGLPKILRDRQLAINAGERKLLGHVAWLEGPCGEIKLALVHPDSLTAASKFGPGSFLASLLQGAQAGQKIIDLYHIEDHTDSFITAINFLKSQGDQESTLPAYLFGSPSPGAGDESVKGITVRSESLIDFIKDLAKNFDDANVSFIMGLYRWNMEYGQDAQIKGDLQCKAIGSAQALIKDAIREEIGFIFQSLPDELKPYFNWEEVARILARTFTEDVASVVLPQAEVERRQAPLIEKQRQIEDLNAQLALVKGMYEQAKAEMTLAKAEKIRTEIPHDADRKEIDNEKARADIEKTHAESMKTHVDAAVAIHEARHVGQKPNSGRD